MPSQPSLTHILFAAPFQMNEAAAPQSRFAHDDDATYGRPATARTLKTARQRYIVIAMTENRAREVGLCGT